MSFGRLIKSIAQAKAKGQVPEDAGTQATISLSGGSGLFGKIAQATGVSKKMNGDTSVPATTQRLSKWGVNVVKKRNNIFGN